MVLKDVQNQRPRYFAGQYLLEEDFELEQDYHIDRQCRHNRLLHVSGIAEGLSVELKDNKLTVSSGTAVDKYGQQIVLLKNQTVEELPSNNGEYILFIQYTEENGSEQSGTQNGYRRIVEKPSIKVDSVNTVPDNAIKLAKLAIAQGKITNPIDLNVREYSGLRLPSPANEGLTLRSGGDNASNLAVLSGGLSVQGSLSVTNKVGIGTTNPAAKLEVKGSTKDNTETALKITDSDANNLLLIRNDGKVTIGTTRNPNITDYLNPDSQVGTKASLVVASKTKNRDGNTNLVTESVLTLVRDGASGQSWPNIVDFRIGRYDKLNDTTHSSYTQLDILLANRDLETRDESTKFKQVMTLRANGNVGIGTTTPTETLEVAGNVKITGTRIKNSEDKGIIETDKQDYLRINPDGSYPAIALYNPVAIGSGGLAIGEWTQQGQGVLKVTKSAYLATSEGKVGIGTTSPSAKLEIKLAGSTTDASLKLEHNGSNFIVRPLTAGGSSSAIENTGGGSLLINPTGGKVGIGIQSEPLAQLHVTPNTPNGGGIAIGNPNIYTSDKYTNLYLVISAEKDGYGEIQAYSSGTNPGNLILNRQGGKVGIGKTSEMTKYLDANSKVGTNASLVVASKTKNLSANGENYIRADTESVLTLVRDGVSSKSWSNIVDFRIGRYGDEQSNNASRTQLDILLTDRDLETPNESTKFKQVMTLLANGNVGIGTLKPSYQLNVDPNGTGGILIGNTSDDSTSLILSISAKNDGYGEIQAVKSSGSLYGDLILNRRAGNVGIGKENPDPNFRLDVQGKVQAHDIHKTSDIRWKQNIETIASALDKVLQLRGVSFEWRTEEYQEMNFNPGKHLGLIAQEVEQVIPEVVHQNDQGYKSLAYSNLVALLIEALKELQDKHENLLPTMQAQQAEIEGLRDELSRLRVSLIQPA
ncbi:MAG: tail fiber domain-containing protein [Nostoc sp. DedQUE12a]|nr:tail fiber domain-containing protein [Nostoc sp. DedQUE12a]